MKHRNLFVATGGICAATTALLAFIGVPAPLLFLLIGICSVVAFFLFRGRRRSGNSTSTTDTPNDRPPEPGYRDITDAVAAEGEQCDGAVLTAAFAGDQWSVAEQEVDSVLDNALSCITEHLPIHTAAIFFPRNEGGFLLRRFFSNSQFVDSHACILPGAGVIGSFLQKGGIPFRLNEILSDSTTLHYYLRDAGVRSCVVAPISGGNAKRGFCVVDSITPACFTDEHMVFLSNLGAVCGEAVYRIYRSVEHRLNHLRLSAMSATEKKFFQKNNLHAILDTMADILPRAITCDRMSISLLLPDTPTAVVQRATGVHADRVEHLSFPVTAKSLAGMVFQKNISISRDFAADRYEPRYFEDEEQTREFKSFIAFPVGVATCRSVILLESFRPGAFTTFDGKLLSRLAISAGLAIEKNLLIEQAENLATHDGLTGLNNHRHFQKILKDEITRSTRYNDKLSLVLCDIDHFKRINDTWGHPFGDVVLRRIAACLQKSIREGVDSVSRYGGEEFTLILVKSDESSAVEMADRIRQNIKQESFRSPRGETVAVTMSFGIACFTTHAKNSEALIAKADKALYRAKKNGRDRVEVF